MILNNKHVGIPAAPVPNDIVFVPSNSHFLTFSWSPSNSTCFSHYSVNVTSIGYTISTTDTNLSLPVPSTNDTEYSISVAAVDTGGRYMNPQGMKRYIVDGKWQQSNDYFLYKNSSRICYQH